MLIAQSANIEMVPFTDTLILQLPLVIKLQLEL